MALTIAAGPLAVTNCKLSVREKMPNARCTVRVVHALLRYVKYRSVFKLVSPPHAMNLCVM